MDRRARIAVRMVVHSNEPRPLEPGVRLFYFDHASAAAVTLIA